MSSLQLFNYEHHEVRTVLIEGELRIILSDIAKILGYRDASTAARILRDHHKGYAEVRTPGGDQRMMVVTEQGFNRLVIRSNAANAEKVQDWITDEVLPQIGRTGSYNAPAMDVTSLEGIAQLAQAAQNAVAMAQAERDRADMAVTRAERSEAIVEIIENGEGASLREFHKQYFSDLPERQFFNLLYRKKLLIDQRGTVWDKKNEKWVNGKDHGHPTYQGKPFFFLNGSIEKATGKRRYQTKVRPGKPEVTLIAKIETFGLTSNRNKTTLNMKELF